MTKPTMAMAELAEKGPDADLLHELGVPALLEDFARQTVAGFGLVVVLREGALGLVARLLQLPLQGRALVAAIALQLRNGHQAGFDRLRRDHGQDVLAQPPIDGGTPEAQAIRAAALEVTQAQVARCGAVPAPVADVQPAPTAATAQQTR